MDRNELTFDGFVFANPEDLELGKNEERKIKYIKERTDFNNPTVLKTLYDKAIETRAFQTPIGLSFMHELRDSLISLGYKDEEVNPIPLYTTFRRINLKDESIVKKRVTKQEKKEMSLRMKYRNAVFIAIIFGLLAVIMFGITLSGPNINAINYKRAVTNEYAAWEQDLTNRENIVREKERELGINDN